MRRIVALLLFFIPALVLADQPTVSDTEVSLQNSNSETDQPFTMPSPINPDDVCIAIQAVDSSAPTWDDATIGTWTELELMASGGVGLAAYKIVDDGTSDGVTVTPTSGVGERSATIAICLGNTTGGLDAVEGVFPEASTTTDTPDPPAITPSWGDADWMCIAAAVWDGAATVSTYPTGFDDNQTTIASENIAGTGVAIATDAISGTTCDPGPFTISAEDGTIAMTIAVRGASSASAVPVIIQQH